METPMKTRSLLALGLVLALGACSPIRPSKFQCPHPEGVSCMSTLEVYEHTEYASEVSGRGQGKAATHASVGSVRVAGVLLAWVAAFPWPRPDTSEAYSVCS
jgi:hypothetical protein